MGELLAIMEKIYMHNNFKCFIDKKVVPGVIGARVMCNYEKVERNIVSYQFFASFPRTFDEYCSSEKLYHVIIQEK